MYCKNCGRELKSENKFCPFCGTETSNMAEPVSSPDGQKKPKKKVWMVLPALVAAICIAFGVYRVVNIVSENSAKEEWVATVKEDGKWYVINGKNEKLAEIALDNILTVHDFNEYGVAEVNLDYEEESIMTYINTNGEILRDPFNLTLGLWDGNWNCGRGFFSENGKKGFIDVNGEVKVLPVYDEVKGFGKNGLAAVKMDDLWGYVDTEGKMVIEPSYLYADSFSTNGLGFVITQEGEVCCINDKGEVIIKTEYNAFDVNCHIFPFDTNGLSQVSIDGKWGIMDEKGVMIIEPVFDSAVWPYDNDCFCIRLEGKAGIMDAQGEMRIPLIYDSLARTKEGFYTVEVNDKYGVVNLNGEEVIETDYKSIQAFGEESWIAFSDGYDGYKEVWLLKNDGTIVERWENDEMGWYTWLQNEEAGEEELFGVKIDGTWTFIDHKDRVKFKTKVKFLFMDNVINFTGSPIVVYSDDACGYIDANGKLMIDFQYEEANSFFDKGSLENLQI